MHQFLSLRRLKNRKEATMREALKLNPLWTSYLFSAALLGAVLALIALLPTGANAQEAPPEQVAICHKPGTPAQKNQTIPSTALEGHLGHGDTEGLCCPCTASGSAMELNKIFMRQNSWGSRQRIIVLTTVSSRKLHAMTPKGLLNRMRN